MGSTPDRLVGCAGEGGVRVVTVCDFCQSRGGEPHTCPIGADGCGCPCNDADQAVFVVDDERVVGVDRAAGRYRG